MITYWNFLGKYLSNKLFERKIFIACEIHEKYEIFEKITFKCFRFFRVFRGQI